MKRAEGVIVEWDERKNKANIRKHKVSFGTAAKVFDDENRVETYDYRHSGEEDRYKVIGLVNNVLVVICTERRRKIRIISARKATAEERKMYYGKNR